VLKVLLDLKAPQVQAHKAPQAPALKALPVLKEPRVLLDLKAPPVLDHKESRVLPVHKVRWAQLAHKVFKELMELMQA
jgi:hypothetical protein